MIAGQRWKACSHDLKINFFAIRISLAYRRYALKHDNDFAGIGIKKKRSPFSYITLHLFVIGQGMNVPEVRLPSIFCALWEIKASNILP